MDSSWYFQNYEFTPVTQSLPNISSFYSSRESPFSSSSTATTILNDLTPVKPSELNDSNANSSTNRDSGGNKAASNNGQITALNPVSTSASSNDSTSLRNVTIVKAESNKLSGSSNNSTSGKNSSPSSQNGPSKKKKTR